MAPVDADSLDMTDAGNKAFWENETTRALTEKTMKLSDANSADYDAVFYVGGFGTMWDFPDDPDVHRLAREMYEGGKVVRHLHPHDVGGFQVRQAVKVTPQFTGDSHGV